MNEFAWREMTLQDRTNGIQWLIDSTQRNTGKSKANMPQDFFPETGITVLYRDKPAAVITVYLELTTNTAVLGVCMLNTSLSARVRHRAAEAAIGHAVEYVRKLGKKYILSLFGNRAVNRIADRQGFFTADKNVEEKFLILNEQGV